MHRVTYSRITAAIKSSGSFLFILVILCVLSFDFIASNSSFSNAFMYIIMSVGLLFFLTTFIIFTYFLFKPSKLTLLSFDNSGFYYENEFIPYESVTLFGYGLNRKKFWTMIFEGFVIKTTTREIVIPTYQLLFNKEVKKWVIDPLEKYAPKLFKEEIEWEYESHMDEINNLSLTTNELVSVLALHGHDHLANEILNDYDPDLIFDEKELDRLKEPSEQMLKQKGYWDDTRESKITSGLETLCIYSSNQTKKFVWSKFNHSEIRWFII